MLPDRCAIVKGGRRCPNPPEYTVTVASGQDEYMVGVACSIHRQDVARRIHLLQKEGGIPEGTIGFTPLHPVGTDCIRADPEDLVSIRPTQEREG